MDVAGSVRSKWVVFAVLALGFFPFSTKGIAQHHEHYALSDQRTVEGMPVDLEHGHEYLTNFQPDSYPQNLVSESAYSVDRSGYRVSESCQSEFGWINFDTSYTFPMLDFQNRQGDKETFILEDGRRYCSGNQFILGAQFRASGLFARTNRDGRFSYLGRFPTDFTGGSASDFRLLHANQNVTVHLNGNVHGYFETLFSDVFSFQSFNQGSYQVRQAYVVFGNFDRSPWYAHIGKKNTSFGDMGTLSPFTQAMTWHYFAPLAEGAGIGFDNGLINATLTALNGSRGIRVVDSDEKGHLNNFAANVLLRSNIGPGTSLEIGGGFLHGTIYNAAVPEHTNPNLFGPNNAAWDVNAKLRMGAVQFAGEYVQTVDPWPATDHEVIAYRTEAAVDTCFGRVPGVASVSWSEGIQGEAGTEFEFNRQLVLGYQVQPYRNASFTFEYVRSTGFAPLINIRTVSDKDVVQNSFVFGAVISL